MSRLLSCVVVVAGLVCGACKGEEAPAAETSAAPTEPAAPVAEAPKPQAEPRNKKRKVYRGCSPLWSKLPVKDAEVKASLTIEGEAVPLRWEADLAYDPAGLGGPYAGVCGSITKGESGKLGVNVELGLADDEERSFVFTGVALAPGGKASAPMLQAEYHVGKKPAKIMFGEGSITVGPTPLVPGEVELTLDLVGSDRFLEEQMAREMPPEVQARMKGKRYNLKLEVKGTFERPRSGEEPAQ